MSPVRSRLVAPKPIDLSRRSLRPRRLRKTRTWAIGIASALLIAGLALFLLEFSPSFTPVGERKSSEGVELPTASVATCFTPSQPCATEIIERLNSAKAEIRAQAYGFTSGPIAAALIEARERGLDVAVILDKSNEPGRGYRYSDADLVARAGIPVFIDYRPAIAHNKVIVIDRHLVITGSYNFTDAAEHRNAENVTFIDSAEVARQFLLNWNSRKEVSRSYVEPAP